MLSSCLLCCCTATALSAAAPVKLSLNATAPRTPFRRLWRTAPIGAPESGLGQLSSNIALIRALPVPPKRDKNGNTVLFTERISRVRLLGGWKGGSGDCVTVSPSNKSYDADWSCLYSRLDSVAAANLSCVVVFDNVPWAFVRNKTHASGSYGNAKGPDKELRPLFAQYINEMMSKLATRYGHSVVANWQYRAATEPNCLCHWLDSADDYLWFYDTLASAVKDTLGETAEFGPGNFPRGQQMQLVDYVLKRLANKSLTRHPPDVLGISYYGNSGNGYRHSDMIGTASWMNQLVQFRVASSLVTMYVTCWSQLRLYQTREEICCMIPKLGSP